MAYFNPFTKLDEVVTSSTQEALYEGGYQQTDIETNLYRCEGRTQYGSPCRLVWTRARFARDCAARKHRNQFTDTYYHQVVIEGKPSVIEQSYVRQAVRRDGARPGPVTASVAPPAAPAPLPQLALADLKAQALALGFRLHRIPVKASEPEVFDVPEDLSEEPVF